MNGETRGVAWLGSGAYDQVLGKLRSISSISQSELEKVINVPAVVWVKNQKVCKIFGLNGITFLIKTTWKSSEETMLSNIKKEASNKGLPLSEKTSVKVQSKTIVLVEDRD